MNQILVIDKYNIVNHKKYLRLFFISVCISILLLFYFFYFFYSRINEFKITNLLKNKYNINSLYSANSEYTTLKVYNNISIIGAIDIPKINISYPIIENTTNKLLKISVCRFAGPLPNRIGNLCIAGHNYKNNTFFSNLYKLNIGDSIYITDLNNTRLEYLIYDKFIVKANNLECSKNSDKIEITIITCNTANNSERLVIKAKMRE